MQWHIYQKGDRLVVVYHQLLIIANTIEQYCFFCGLSSGSGLETVFAWFVVVELDRLLIEFGERVERGLVPITTSDHIDNTSVEYW